MSGGTRLSASGWVHRQVDRARLPHDAGGTELELVCPRPWPRGIAPGGRRHANAARVSPPATEGSGLLARTIRVRDNHWHALAMIIAGSWPVLQQGCSCCGQVPWLAFRPATGPALHTQTTADPGVSDCVGGPRAAASVPLRPAWSAARRCQKSPPTLQVKLNLKQNGWAALLGIEPRLTDHRGLKHCSHMHGELSQRDPHPSSCKKMLRY